MKIGSIQLFDTYSNKIQFKGYNPEDEYVYVPLIWEDEKDTVNLSQSNNNYADTVSGSNAKQKMAKLKKGALAIGGGVVVLPEAVKGAASKIDSAVSGTKEAYKNTIDSIAEMKEYTKSVFGKNKSEKDNSSSEEIQEEQPYIPESNTDSVAPLIPHQENINLGETNSDPSDVDYPHEADSDVGEDGSDMSYGSDDVPDFGLGM